jgi:hypothetical protein
MFSFLGRPSLLCDRIPRREVLRVGGLSALGLSLPALLQARETVAPGILPTDKTFGRAKNVIFLYLLGGPPQHETFDPKPDAPAEIRGPFKPIATSVPGVHFCELLPRTARIAHKLAVVRSIATDDNNHDSSGYQLLTGSKYIGPNSRTIQPTDWPYFGSLVKQFKPSEIVPPLTTVWIPDVWRLNENVTPAGQTAGFLGGQWNPDVFVGDPADPQYEVQGLRRGSVTPAQLERRQSLLRLVETPFEAPRRGQTVQLYDKFQQQAFELMTSDKARAAFDIRTEPQRLKERYGRGTWSACLILARRLIESGARLVHVNWPREPGDNAVDNPLWDTHAQNADRLEDVLCPQFDVGFTALIDDLDERGLLAETLVVAIGEFGRTPKINGNGGRDHWGPVFSFVMAGAGIAGGQVFGASDSQGAYPARDRVSGADFTATIFHLLGIDWTGSFHDREGREHKLTTGEPIYKLLGTEPATRQRATPGGDVARVPPFDGRTLRLNDFTSPAATLVPADAPSRPKGWRAAPIADAGSALGATIEGGTACLGIGLGRGSQPLRIEAGTRVFLGQEVLSPFAGKYVARATVAGDSPAREFFESVFLKHFTCKLLFYQYLNQAKKATEHKELAAVTFQPKFLDPQAPQWETLELPKVFENPNPGQNFSFGNGLGVAVVVEKTSPGSLELRQDELQRAMLRVRAIHVEFVGKPRKDDVTV